ncbi:MAG: isoprenylcysteine carboxylmethyltransferase family protein [Nitrospirae bacterium]|nr:isoprenylcysteine carboxylmethyltransferase family protein [Nitrospirota bacterium]
MFHRGLTLNDILAIITLMFWGLVPLFWIPVHGFSAFFKKLGIFTYITPVVTWIPFAWLIYANREFLLRYQVSFPLAAISAGWIVLALGTLLQLWTLKLLRGWGLIGLPEVTRLVQGRIITTGPFSVIRHPTYLSHTIMYAGVFLITGFVVIGTITLLDIIVINTLVIPLEDRELVERFGEEYRRYKDRVPAFFPVISKK